MKLQFRVGYGAIFKLSNMSSCHPPLLLLLYPLESECLVITIAIYSVISDVKLLVAVHEPLSLSLPILQNIVRFWGIQEECIQALLETFLPDFLIYFVTIANNYTSWFIAIVIKCLHNREIQSSEEISAVWCCSTRNTPSDDMFTKLNIFELRRQ